MRAAGVHGQDLPSPQAAAQAVNVVLHNAKRSVINVSSAHATGAGPATVHGAVDQSGATNSSPVPRWVRGPWGFAVGDATIVAGVAGVATWQGGHPCRDRNRARHRKGDV